MALEVEGVLLPRTVLARNCSRLGGAGTAVWPVAVPDLHLDDRKSDLLISEPH